MNNPTQTTANTDPLQNQLEGAIKRNRRWYVIQGIFFLVIGVLALLLPGLTVIAVELLLGALLVIGGALQLYQGSVDRSGGLLITGTLSLIVGIAMWVLPMSGAIALATVIAIFLLLDGIVKTTWAFSLRSSASWGWLLASGVLSLLLGALLLFGWPEQTVVLAGIVLGINFLFYGVTMLAIAAGTKRDSNR